MATTISNTDLRGANIEGVNLSNTTITNCNFNGTNFNRADLHGLTMNNITQYAGKSYGRDFEYDRSHPSWVTYYYGQDALNFLNIAGANVSGAVANDNFVVSDRTYAVGADLSNTILNNANFVDANLDGHDFSGKDLSDSIWERTFYSSCNITVVGAPQHDNLSFTGFSKQNYLAQGVFDPGENTWEHKWKLKLTSYGDTDNAIFQSLNTGSSGIEYCINTDGKFKWWINNSTTTFVSAGVGNYVVPLNTWIYVKVEFTGDQYKLSYSLDNETWTRDLFIYNDTFITACDHAIGIDYQASTTPIFHGHIDLTESYIKIGDNIWWEGCTSVGKTTCRFNEPTHEFYVDRIVKGNDSYKITCSRNVVCAWQQPILTENGSLGQENFAVSSSQYNANYAAYRAFAEGNAHGSCWASANNEATNNYIIYNPYNLKVSNFAIQNRLSGSNAIGAINSLTISASNNNTDYTQLTTYTNTNTTYGSTWNVTIPNNVQNNYKYYKFTMTHSGAYACMNHVEITATCIL